MGVLRYSALHEPYGDHSVLVEVILYKLDVCVHEGITASTILDSQHKDPSDTPLEQVFEQAL